MRYLSVCSGIEAATVAWHPLGWEAAGFAEIEAFPAAVLAHHYPAVRNYGDMTKHKEWDLGAIDLLVGGTPCQSFSVAGLRKGLDDSRGNLMLTYLAIADQRRPRWLVWENVPGVLSSNGGKDFGTFLGALAELGYGFAYRVLDAQYFGVAQRRRRVFVVGYLGNWRPAAAVLFEPESLRGDTAPSRETRQKVARIVAPSLTASNDPSRSPQSSEVTQQVAAVTAARMVAFGEYIDDGTASAMKARDYKDATDLVAQPIPINSMNAMRSPHADASTGCGIGDEGEAMFTITKGNHHAVAQPIAFQSVDHGADATENLSPTLRRHDPMAVAQPIGIFQDSEFGVQQYNTAGTLRAGRIPEHQMALQPIAFQLAGDRDNPSVSVSETAFCLPANPMSDRGQAVAASMAVRRLTPVECERLQGFPDNYTNIPWRKADQSPDGPRYKALGNSMAVPVMHWIGRRISVYEDVMGKA